MRLRGSAAAGRAYERKIVRKVLPKILPEDHILQGQWLVYQLEDDTAPRRFAQPDALILQGDILWVFECKLTHVIEAGQQLCNLYAPLLEKIWPGREQVRIEVCQNIAPLGEDPPRLNEPADIFNLSRHDWYVWHCMR